MVSGQGLGGGWAPSHHPPAGDYCTPAPAGSAAAAPGRAPAGFPAAPLRAAAAPEEPSSQPPALHSAWHRGELVARPLPASAPEPTTTVHHSHCAPPRRAARSGPPGSSAQRAPWAPAPQGPGAAARRGPARSRRGVAVHGDGTGTSTVDPGLPPRTPVPQPHHSHPALVAFSRCYSSCLALLLLCRSHSSSGPQLQHHFLRKPP